MATETKKSSKLATSASHDNRKKSLIDSGIEMIFKKHHRHQPATDDHHTSTLSLASDLKFRPDIILDSAKDLSGRSGSISALASGSLLAADEKKSWKPFESIKIYTERRRSHDVVDAMHNKSQAPPTSHTGDGFVMMGEECSGSGGSAPRLRLTSDASLLDEHGSPRKTSKKTMLSGNKQTDQLLHTFIDYILRDYIDSWFCSLSDNKEFSEFRARNCIEESVQNLCNRIKNTQWIPLMTTKLVDNIATHSRLYRLGCQTSSVEPAVAKEPTKQKLLSPQKRSLKKDQHRRNKSDTDLSWYLGGNSSATATPAPHKNVANSKFYTATKPVDENTLIDPEAKLLNAFFDNSDVYKNECLSETALESTSCVS